MEITKEFIAKIRPYEKNAKKHSDQQVEKIANSIKQFGMNQPIVTDKNGVIIIGHGRFLALKFLNWELKPEFFKVVNLTEKEAKAYRIADNKLNESDWDYLNLLDDLKELDSDLLDLTGFDLNIIENITTKNEAENDFPVEYENENILGSYFKKLPVHFVTEQDMNDFADLIGQKITKNTKYIYFPFKEKENIKDLEAEWGEDE